MNDLRILIVADDPLARAGLAVLLADQPDCNVIGQVSGETAGNGGVEAFQADVMVWDLGWDSAAALEHLSALPEGSTPTVAILSDQSQAGEAWAAGARGILPRETDAETLRASLIAVAQGLVTLDQRATTSLLPSSENLPAAPLGGLTSRELEVLQLLSEGLANKAVAARLSISEHTVKFHVNAIMGKLGAQSRTDAVIRATRAGLIIL